MRGLRAGPCPPRAQEDACYQATLDVMGPLIIPVADPQSLDPPPSWRPCKVRVKSLSLVMSEVEGDPYKYVIRLDPQVPLARPPNDALSC